MLHLPKKGFGTTAFLAVELYTSYIEMRRYHFDGRYVKLLQNNL